MGQGESRTLHGGMTKHQHIQIQRARGMGVGTLSARLIFDGLQSCEQIGRRQSGFNPCHGVHKIRPFCFIGRGAVQVGVAR